jgi:nucleoside-diphosphate-sugar epimerase
MITLVGHGYVGRHIAKELREQALSFQWVAHDQDWHPLGPIINAAGYTGSPNVDACEAERHQTIEGNIIWPLRCERRAGDYPVVHISSGCIYMGGPFSERDEPNFEGSFYSWSKAREQEVLKPFMNKSYVLRMRMPFGVEEHSKNLLTKLRRYPKLIDGINSLSRVEDVASVAVHFAHKRPPFGIYNLVNPGWISTMEIVNMMGIKKEWFTKTEFERSIKAPRSFCSLWADKLKSVYPIADVRTALSECLTDTRAVLSAA